MSAGDPIALSLLVALSGAAIGLPPAVGLGFVLARRRFRGKALVSALVLLPLVLPPVVTGLLLLRVFGRRGMLGPWLASAGIQIPFTTLGAVLAAAAVGLPLYVLAARAAFESVDPRLEEMARTLGASRASTFFRISLPLAAPGLSAGAVLAFARALGEFGATAILAGDVPGRTRTIALAVYASFQSPSGEPEVMRLAGASVAMSIAALSIHELLIARHRRRLGGEIGARS
jgi:molybdate transport system permease protein